MPAPIEAEVLERLRATALTAYRVTDCAVLTRVDMFLTTEGKVIVNELNTLPGFTSISVYPKLWAHDGISQTELISQLIAYAFERHESQQALAMDF